MNCQGLTQDEKSCVCLPWTNATQMRHTIDKTVCAKCKGDEQYLNKMMADAASPPCQDDPLAAPAGISLANKLLNESAKQICADCPSHEICPVYKSVPCKVGLPGYDCPENRLCQRPDKHYAYGRNVFANRHGDKLTIIDLYKNKSCFLVCNGPSVTNYEKHLLNQPGIISMGINNGAVSAEFRPTLWTAQDPPWKFMPGIWEDPKILKFTLWGSRNYQIYDPETQSWSKRKIKEMPGIVFHRRHSDFDAAKWFDDEMIVWGRPKDSGGNRSTMMAALHILWFLGFVDVYLLGADFRMTPETKYFFDEDRSKASIRSNNRLFKNIGRYFAQLQPYMLKQGFRVWNCNPDSQLAVFPFRSLESAIRSNVINTSVSAKGMYGKHTVKG